MENSNLLTEIMQIMQTLEMSNHTEPDTTLPPPFDTLYKIRTMLPAREQKIIDMMIKFHEIRVLMDEIKEL